MIMSVGMEWIILIVLKAGFDVDINLYSQKFSVEDQKRYGLLVNEILPVVLKGKTLIKSEGLLSVFF